MESVQRSLDVPVDADRVWDEVTKGDWLGDDVQLDPRVGGEGFILDGGVFRHVVVETVEPGRRLTYRWWPLTDDGVGRASRVTIAVEPEEEMTRVVIVEAPVLVAAPLPSQGPLALARL